MNNKLIVGRQFCNLEKVFVYVSHNILLAKLKFYGINGRDFALYKSYLENRYQRIALCNEIEACNKVSSWAKVLQGLVLGPFNCSHIQKWSS